MHMKRWMPILLVTALAVGGFAGLSAIGKVSAQSPTTTATATATTKATAAATTTTPQANSSTDQESPSFERGLKGDRAGYSSQELATALGVTSDALTKAQAEAQSAALAKAVADGLITQAQADEISANGSAFPFGGSWNAWLSAKGIEFDSFLADALGISTDDLAAARSKALAAHLSTLVANGSLTQDQADLIEAQQALAGSTKFTSAMQSAFETAVAQAVKDGTITQAQADLLLAKVTQNGGFNLGWGGMDGMKGGRHGR